MWKDDDPDSWGHEPDEGPTHWPDSLCPTWSQMEQAMERERRPPPPVYPEFPGPPLEAGPSLFETVENGRPACHSVPSAVQRASMRVARGEVLGDHELPSAADLRRGGEWHREQWAQVASASRRNFAWKHITTDLPQST